MAPGTRALAFASRWFDPAIVHRTFEPLIADWQREWCESAPSKRRWVSVRATSAFVCAVLLSSPRLLATPTPRSLALRVTTRVSLFCLVAATLLSIPMVRSMAVRSMEPMWWGALLLLAMPMTMTMAFPFAMVIAVDAIRRNANVPPHVERAAVVKLGLLAMLFMLTVQGLIVPLADQQWREHSTPAGWNVPEPKFREQTTVALLTHPDNRQDGFVPRHYSRAGAIRRELIFRAVSIVLPALFVWLRWTALSHSRRGRFWPLPGSLMIAIMVAMSFATFTAGSWIEYAWELSPGSSYVVPLLLFSAWTLVEQHVARRTSHGKRIAAHEA